jgi:hypothetical protein
MQTPSKTFLNSYAFYLHQGNFYKQAGSGYLILASGIHFTSKDNIFSASQPKQVDAKPPVKAEK